MTLYMKSILSLILLGSTFVAFFSMFELMGRKEKRFKPRTLRIIHRVNGLFFLLLFLVLSFYCLRIMRAAGHEPSPRVVLHGILAVATFLILCLKISIIRFYRQFFSMVVPLGIACVLLALGTSATSAGYYFTMRGGGGTLISSKAQKNVIIGQGEDIFRKNCSDCHYADKTENKIGPGLKGLFKREKLPDSGRPVTEANIRKQLVSPFEDMPSFSQFTDQEMESLLEFLRSL